MSCNNLVSIVVPVYKTQDYLDRCMYSIVNQTYKNIEIILVDDESPDMCPAMCDEWSKHDHRIKVVHKRNAGLGMARNTGIEHAKGDYICFFDSDDYIEKNTIELALKAALDDDVDIVLFGNYRIDKNGKIIKKNIPTAPQRIYRGSEVQDVLLPDLIDNRHRGASVTQVCLSACMCMCSMRLISRTRWRFVSERDIISEDSYSLLCLFEHVKSVALLNDALYYHCENQLSLTQTYRTDRHDRNRKFYNSSMLLVKEKGYCEQVKCSVAGLFLGISIATMKQIAGCNLNAKEKCSLLKKLVEDETIQDALQQVRERSYNGYRMLLFWVMRHEFVGICYFLLTLRNIK